MGSVIDFSNEGPTIVLEDYSSEETHAKASTLHDQIKLRLHSGGGEDGGGVDEYEADSDDARQILDVCGAKQLCDALEALLGCKVVALYPDEDDCRFL